MIPMMNLMDHSIRRVKSPASDVCDGLNSYQTPNVNGKTYFRLAWEHRHALSLFGTAPRARVRPNHSSPIDPVRHQHQMFIATECIPFPISGSRCRGAFLFLFQAIDAGHLVYITMQFPQH